MAGFNPNARQETPEEKVDRLIYESETSMNISLCAELQNALVYIHPNDEYRRNRANNVLARCRENRFL